MKEIQDIDLKQLIEDETGEKFNREGYIKCPFHNEKSPSFSIKFIPNANKHKYRCWGCDATGDAIDFIMNLKNVDYKNAREILGIQGEKTERELQFDKILSRIDWDVKNSEYKPGYKLLALFEFVNEQNEIVYYKAKFLKPDGKKASSYYRFSGEKIINNRDGIKDLPYNLYNVLQGVNNGKTIIFVEGEKDANNINNLLKNKNYVATSIKGCTDYEIIKLEFMKIMVLGDTGVAGEQYVNKIKFNFLKGASSFKIINLPGLKAMGNNKDVTDWLEAGHTKKDLLNAFDRALDLKNKKELQQDNYGIYSSSYDSESKEYEPKYLTNFSILEAYKGYNRDKNEEQIVLKLKNNKQNKMAEKVESSKIFSDQKAFRDFLGLDYSYRGSKITDLIRLKDWIIDYFALEEKQIYEGSRFVPLENGKFELVTSKGSVSPTGFDNSKIAVNNNITLEAEEINKEELQELMQYLFKFLDYNQALNVIGSIFSFFEVGQNMAIREKLHHLCFFGEAQSGKSTILEHIIIPLLNCQLEDRHSVSSSIASLKSLFSAGNYPIVLDEYKPSEINRNKLPELADLFRILYDRATTSKGNKDFTTKDFKLERPLILAGEEGFPNSSKSLMTRCCIILMAENQQTEDTTAAVKYLIDHEEQLRKLGKSLILEALNLPVEEYKSLREELREKFDIKARPLNTCVNIACGIELLNKVLIKHDLQPIEGYHESIEANIRETVLEGAEGSRSTIERMIMLFNEILQDNNYAMARNAVKTERGKTYIRSQVLVDTIHKYNRDYQSVDITILKIKDFKTQAKKAGYITGMSSKQIRDKETNINAKYDEYDTRKLVDLEVGQIVECDLMEEAVSMAEQKILQMW